MGTPYSEFTDDEADVRLRQRLVALDHEVLGESHQLLGISRNVVNRLARFNGLEAEPLYHPPPLAGRLRRGPSGDYVLSVGRLEANKRVDLVIRGLAYTSSLKSIVAGEGPLSDTLAALASDLELRDRVVFTGAIGEEELVGLYENALASCSRLSTRTTDTSRSRCSSPGSRSSLRPTPEVRWSLSRMAFPAWSSSPRQRRSARRFRGSPATGLRRGLDDHAGNAIRENSSGPPASVVVTTGFPARNASSVTYP